jgi:sugar phosphate isomerase/epimerase
MRLGYNTNGFPHHRLGDALRILADLGYQSVALTLDYYALNPFGPEFQHQLHETRLLLQGLHLRSVVETGARFLLDPRRKHQPTLLSPEPEGRARRLDFLQRAVEVACALQSDAVSFWSGTPVQPEAPEVLWRRLIDGCRRLTEYAARRQMRLAFEPEPGMFIDTLAKCKALMREVDSPWFGLTIDIGHLHCLGEVPICERFHEWKDVLWNLHIEDMRRGVHEHLMFGEGEIDFRPILVTLKEIGYGGGLHVELSRHGHNAVVAAREARDFLQAHWPAQ